MSEDNRTPEERVGDWQKQRATPTVGEAVSAISSLTGIQPKMVDIGNGAVAATYSMTALKDALLGDETLDEIVASKRCSKNVGCGKSLVKDDGSPVYVFDTRGEAETYEMEYRRTGLCPSCLNAALTSLDDGDFPYGEPERDVPHQPLRQLTDRERAVAADPDAWTTAPLPECNGICLTGSDIGIPSSGVAYPHPECPLHGDPDDVPADGQS